MKSNNILPEKIDSLAENVVFNPDTQVKKDCRKAIRELALGMGIFPASIEGLYEAAGKGLYDGITVPAINIRGLTYQVARAIFRTALRHKVGAFIFEIARSEIGYTRQRPAEYASCVLAAAIRERFRGPVFIQGDHFQVNQTRYRSEPEKELNTIKKLIHEAVNAGFLNIDIDASTLVDLGKQRLKEQQERNYLVTADITDFIRSVEPEGTTISIGGEIGEVGKRNSTIKDLRAFMTGYLDLLGSGTRRISKISVQTGTTHGGVVLPNGSIANVMIDFKVLRELSRLAREEYGMGGAVQHGASTLPDEAFHMFPEAGTLEVHLATGFQNLIFDSPYFPRALLDDIYRHLLKKYAYEREPGDSDEQFLYKTRKRGWGDFKNRIRGIPEENLEQIIQLLEERFSLIFNRLNVFRTTDLVNRFVSG